MSILFEPAQISFMKGLAVGVAAIISLVLPIGAAAQSVTEYAVYGGISGITAGPDGGALWFAENNGNKIQRITTELTEIVPSSAPAGEAYPLQATIHGVGFMPTGNVVKFGPVKITDLPSPEGTRITFFIPKLIPSRSEVPPMVLQPGEYRVTVTTDAGTSNALIFRLTRGP
jgi:hypothetical protein